MRIWVGQFLIWALAATLLWGCSPGSQTKSETGKRSDEVFHKNHCLSLTLQAEHIQPRDSNETELDVFERIVQMPFLEIPKQVYLSNRFAHYHVPDVPKGMNNALFGEKQGEEFVRWFFPPREDNLDGLLSRMRAELGLERKAPKGPCHASAADGFFPAIKTSSRSFFVVAPSGYVFSIKPSATIRDPSSGDDRDGLIAPIDSQRSVCVSAYLQKLWKNLVAPPNELILDAVSLSLHVPTVGSISQTARRLPLPMLQCESASEPTAYPPTFAPYANENRFRNLFGLTQSDDFLWKSHVFEPVAKALSFFTIAGIYFLSPHAQNFVFRVQTSGASLRARIKPTPGARDLGDVLLHEHLAPHPAQLAADFPDSCSKELFDGRILERGRLFEGGLSIQRFYEEHHRPPRIAATAPPSSPWVLEQTFQDRKIAKHLADWFGIPGLQTTMISPQQGGQGWYAGRIQDESRGRLFIHFFGLETDMLKRMHNCVQSYGQAENCSSNLKKLFHSPTPEE